MSLPAPVVKGRLKVNIETVLPLPEALKAQELSKTGHSDGKIVLEMPATLN